MATAVAERTLSSQEVLAYSGATYRQIDYWSRTGVLKPTSVAPGSGYYRSFSSIEAEVANRLVKFMHLCGAGRGSALPLIDAANMIRASIERGEGTVITLGEGVSVVIEVPDAE